MRCSAPQAVCLFLCVAALTAGCCGSTVSLAGKSSMSSNASSLQVVNWTVATAVSKTTPTLQAVINPMFNNATSWPVSEAAWTTLSSLRPQHARFAAWFPYPQWGVAELYPPMYSSSVNETSDTDSFTCLSTSWSFDGLLSQLLPFSASVSSLVLDVSTLPQWFFSATSGFNASVASNTADWAYTTTGTWLPNSSTLAAEYYGRVASFLFNGEMVDECGARHIAPGGSGVPVLDRALTVWEVFNEPEYEMRGAGPDEYVATFDAIALAVRAAADPNHTIQFQGLALQYHGEWNWWRAFLDPGNHVPDARDAVNLASFHFYSVLGERVDNSTWTFEMFDPVDDFVQECRMIVALRDAINPTVRLNADECGSILPGDNDAGAPLPSHLYFVASASMYCYLFALLSVVGIDIVGESQLGGTPVQPKFDIFDAQYPSVSMLNWTTGLGNARFHALSLIQAHLSPGDVVHETRLPLRSEMCGAAWNSDPLGLHWSRTVNLSCAATPGALVETIAFARAGNFTGDCTNFGIDEPHVCVDNGTAVLAWVERVCVGQPSCSLNLSQLADLTQCVDGGPTRLAVKALCSGGSLGMATPSAYREDRVFIQARTLARTGEKFLLLVNKNNAAVTAPMNFSALRVAHAILLDSNEPPAPINISQSGLTLPPFATAFVTLEG